MKKRISMFLLAAMLTVSAGCGLLPTGSTESTAENESSESIIKETDELQKFDEYNLDVYMKPLWSGDLVYNETLMFVGDSDFAPLLYPAVEIISVRSYDLKKEYVRGVDYEYDPGTNSIILGEDTDIPYIPLNEYYPSTLIPGQAFECTIPGKPYIAFSEGSHFSSKQVAVTYRHTGAKNLTAPKSQKEAFNGTIEKLKNNQAPKILFYGDSITVGGNSSGFVNYGPYADVWAKMVFDSMTKKYGCSNAEYINTAVGGWKSQNGLDSLDESVIAHAPDAVFIAFGMNDGDLTPVQHIQNIRTMVSRIRAALPDTEICLVTTMLPNEAVKGFYQLQYMFDTQYLSYLEELKTAGESKICVANVTEMHKQILETKRYYDMTGNNVNHVNDFMARVYAQTVFQTVCGD